MDTVAARELTTTDVIECAREVEKMAITSFLQRPRIIDGVVRRFLTENHQGTSTLRQDFDEATRRYLMGKWEIQ